MTFCILTLMAVLLMRSSLANPFDDSFTVDLTDVPISPQLATLYSTIGDPQIQPVAGASGGIRVYACTGYSLVNTIILDNPGVGAIVVDTTDSAIISQQILASFRQISSSPIKAIIYTHAHGDHFSGTDGYVEDFLNPPEVWAHANFNSGAVAPTYTVVSHVGTQRNNRVFGFVLNETQRAGTKGYHQNFGRKLYIPNKFISVTSKSAENHIIAGINIDFYFAPGETNDMITMLVQVDGKKVLLPGDDFYDAYPNVYAVRGIGRDIPNWIGALDLLRSLGADVLVPSHVQPVYGADKIYNELTIYRDAIQFVHDQTVRFTNQGLESGDIVPKVIMPPSLQEKSSLHNTYGSLDWVSRYVFDIYMGWFSGNALDLNPFSRKDTAKRVVGMLGDPTSFITLGFAAKKAKDALNDNDYQWAAQLADYILLINPSHASAKKTRYLAMKKLAGIQTSMNARFYIMAIIAEQNNLVVNNPPKTADLTNNPQNIILPEFVTRMKGDSASCYNLEINATIIITSPVSQSYGLQMRHGIVQFTTGVLTPSQFTASATDSNWRTFYKTNVFENFSSKNGGLVDILGGPADIVNQFYFCFDKY